MNRVASALLLLAVTCWMASAHWLNVDIAKAGQKEDLVAQVLDGTAGDPYQYKLWIIDHALDRVQHWTGAPLENVWMGNTLLSLLFLVFAHHLWLRRLVSPRHALVGALLLGALANVLFVILYHHTYEYWGVGLFCLLLAMIDRDSAWWKLALVCLVTGVVWEKHALLAVLWGLWQLLRRRPFWPSLAQGLVILGAALAVPLAVRFHLGTERTLIDGMTELHLQEWEKVAWFQLPLLLPFVVMLGASWRRQSTWVRLLWIYLPVLFAAYLVKQYIIHEPRSFWALVPVFTATACVWYANLPREPDTPTEAPDVTTPSLPSTQPAPQP